jgi:hypothetical protein
MPKPHIFLPSQPPPPPQQALFPNPSSRPHSFLCDGHFLRRLHCRVLSVKEKELASYTHFGEESIISVYLIFSSIFFFLKNQFFFFKKKKILKLSRAECFGKPSSAHLQPLNIYIDIKVIEK